MNQFRNWLNDNWWLFSVLFFAIAPPLIFYIYQRFLSRWQKIKLEDFELNIKEIRKAVERTEQRQLAAAIDEKKKKYLNLPNISFHYADKERIRNFYNDYFREPTVENIVSEIANEVSGNIKSSLPQVLEAKAGGKDLSKD